MASRSIFIIGGLLALLGLIMIPLPGPGAQILSVGLLVLVVGLIVSGVAWLSRRRGTPSS